MNNRNKFIIKISFIKKIELFDSLITNDFTHLKNTIFINKNNNEFIIFLGISRPNPSNRGFTFNIGNIYEIINEINNRNIDKISLFGIEITNKEEGEKDVLNNVIVKLSFSKKDFINSSQTKSGINQNPQWKILEISENDFNSWKKKISNNENSSDYITQSQIPFNFKYDIKNFKEFINSLKVKKIDNKNKQIFEKYITNKAETLKRNPSGQYKFRQSLLEEVKKNNFNFVDMLHTIERKKYETLNSDQNLLIASHIKKFSESNDDQTFNKSNGLLLPSYIDVFFDKNLISFDPKTGFLVLSKKIKDILNINEIRILETKKIDEKYLKDKKRCSLLEEHFNKIDK